MAGFDEFFDLVAEVLGGGAEVGGLEVVPDVGDGFGGGVQEVVGIEAVVAEVVEEELVGGEVVGVGECLADGLDGEEEGGFAFLVFEQAVAEVADRADGEDDF